MYTPLREGHVVHTGAYSGSGGSSTSNLWTKVQCGFLFLAIACCIGLALAGSSLNAMQSDESVMNDNRTNSATKQDILDTNHKRRNDFNISLYVLGPIAGISFLVFFVFFLC